LTARITEALQEVSPHFASVDERESAPRRRPRGTRAATTNIVPSFGDSEVVARQLAAAPPTHAPAWSRPTATSRRAWNSSGSPPEVRPERTSIGRLALSAVVLLLAGSLLVTITLVHLPAVFDRGRRHRARALDRHQGNGPGPARSGHAADHLDRMQAWWLGDGWAAVAYGVAVAVGGAVALACGRR
jgi:hypothetical protein